MNRMIAKFPKRRPEEIMTLSRLGSFHQSRLSFMRILLRRLKNENWAFTCKEFEIDNNGVGHAVYMAKGPTRTYSLIAFAHDLPADLRSDRVIAEAWDTTFTLFDGIPTKADIERLSQNVPYQEAGRISEKELSMSRANRSARMWEYVTNTLAEGVQPDIKELENVGYLMRTTAVYGSGKFGAADRETICDRPEFSTPFQVELLSVYLTRWFVRDLANHMAKMIGGDTAAELSSENARAIGIGNSTGLGMAPFILNHPELFNNWIAARENAIATVRNIKNADRIKVEMFLDLYDRAKQLVANWSSQHPVQIEKLKTLRDDLSMIDGYLSQCNWSDQYIWNDIICWSQRLSFEGQEFLASLIFEPYGELVDQFADEMSARKDEKWIDGSMMVSELSDHIQYHYSWALEIDWAAKENCARAWYVSAEKLEPRLGERFEEDITPYEQPLSHGRDVANLFRDIKASSKDQTIAEFLLEHPNHRGAIRRVQLLERAPYSEIRDNTISSSMMPIDMLRCKLSFFGAVHFDPRSDRWVRICMFQNAPYPQELDASDADFWPYPQLDTGR